MDGHKDYTGLKVRRQIVVSQGFLAEPPKSSEVHTYLSEKSAMKILVLSKPSDDPSVYITALRLLLYRKS